MLHGLFEFALRREWCDRNPIKFVERRKVIEKEISPLSIPQIKNLLRTAKLPKYKECLPAIGLLIFAGIRPREVRRIAWSDIDLAEKSITVRSQCSKTGGVRQIEVCPALKRILMEFNPVPSAPVCPRNWNKNGGKLETTQDSKTYGSKIFCATLTQATMQRDLKTCPACN